MKLIPIMSGHFHCDGGAIFGVIPKLLWNNVYPCNKNNFTPLALRCLLVDYGSRKILIEAGVENHYSEKYIKNNGVSFEPGMDKALNEKGYSATDITDVFLTHLHWDHCAGAVKNIDNKLQLAFPNATLWCSTRQWEHAKVSNMRERAAFNREILDFMYNSGKLKFVENEGELFPGFEIRMFDGHTPGQMIPLISTDSYTFAYTSDLIPTAANITLLWIAAYDLYPVTVMEEKAVFLEECAVKNYVLFFEHDYYTECATLTKSDKGVVLKERTTLKDLMPI